MERLKGGTNKTPSDKPMTSTTPLPKAAKPAKKMMLSAEEQVSYKRNGSFIKQFQELVVCIEGVSGV